MSAAVDAALAYLARGWQPLPIKAGEKRPTIAAWQDYSCQAADVPSEFKGTGVGILLGSPSGGLVDVDLDCPEAIRLADKLLPPTSMIHGRPGAEASHRWYTVDGEQRVRQWKDDPEPGEKKGKTLVELRGTGGQTVVPPTPYPGGGAYQWEVTPISPAKVRLCDLQLCVARLASAAYLVRHGWSEAEAVRAACGERPDVPGRVASWLQGKDPDAQQARPLGTTNPYTQSVIETVSVKQAVQLLGVGIEGDRGRCPLREHEKATDSFVIGPDPQVWYCHACEEGGNAIKLVEMVRGMPYAQARKWLGDMGHVPDPWEEEQRARDLAQYQRMPQPPAEPRREPQQEEEGRFQLTLTKGSDLESEDTDWLWYPYLARGELTVLAGMPGTGKSNLTRWLAACVTRGIDLSARTETRVDWLPKDRPEKVDLVMAEDHPTKVAAPRLRIQGADMDLVRLVEHPARLPLNATHLDGFRAAWDVHGPPGLLVLDPASSMIPSGVDANAQSDVKQTVTGPISRLARDYNVAVLLVAHVAKKAPSSGAHVLTWIHGSVEWSAGARGAMVAIRNQHDATDKVVRVFPAKNNLGPEGPAFAYEIVPCMRHCKVEWRGLTGDTPASLTTRPKRQSGPSCSDWLREQLEDGPRCSGDLAAAASVNGFSPYALRQARAALNLVTLPPVEGSVTKKKRWALNH